MNLGWTRCFDLGCVRWSSCGLQILNLRLGCITNWFLGSRSHRLLGGCSLGRVALSGDHDGHGLGGHLRVRVGSLCVSLIDGDLDGGRNLVDLRGGHDLLENLLGLDSCLGLLRELALELGTCLLLTCKGLAGASRDFLLSDELLLDVALGSLSRLQLALDRSLGSLLSSKSPLGFDLGLLLKGSFSLGLFFLSSTHVGLFLSEGSCRCLTLLTDLGSLTVL